MFYNIIGSLKDGSSIFNLKLTFFEYVHLNSKNFTAERKTYGRAPSKLIQV